MFLPTIRRVDRRRFLLTLLSGALPTPAAAQGRAPGTSKPSSPGRLPRVGYVGSGHPSDPESLFRWFAEGLRTFDYVEGQTVTIVWRFAEGRYDRLPGLAAELVSLGVPAIFTPSDHTTAAAGRATQTIPIVFSATDPIASGFVLSLARPGRNMTGVGPGHDAAEPGRHQPRPSLASGAAGCAVAATAVRGVRRAQSAGLRRDIRSSTVARKQCWSFRQPVLHRPPGAGQARPSASPTHDRDAYRVRPLSPGPMAAPGPGDGPPGEGTPSPECPRGGAPVVAWTREPTSGGGAR